MDQLLMILDRLDGGPDHGDGADAEPCLGAPEGDGSQVGWMRGTGRDLKVEAHVAPPRHRPKLDVIGGALTLPTRPEAWCRGAAARDAAGNAVSPCDVGAVAWDIGGAVKRAAGADFGALDAADARRHDLCNGVTPLAVSDDRSTLHASVLSLLRARLNWERHQPSVVFPPQLTAV